MFFSSDNHYMSSSDYDVPECIRRHTHTGAVCKRANENTQCKQALSPVKSVERESACYENADMYSASTYRTEERRTQAPESG